MRNLLILLLLSLFLVGCETMPTQSGAASDAFDRGRAAFDDGRYRRAITDFEEAVRLDPRYGEAFYWLGRSYEAKQQHQQALQAYLDAVNVQPSLGKAHARAGLLYFNRYQYGPAEIHFKKAIDYTSSNALAHYYLGEIYRMQGKCKSSVDMYKKALELNPGLLDAKDGLRRAQSEICGGGKRHHRPARKTYEKADSFTGGGKALKPGEW